MKPVCSLKAVLSLSLLALSLSFNAKAGTLGVVALGGAGCTLAAGDLPLKQVVGQKDRYTIPLQIAVNKKAEEALVRKSCNFRLAVDLEPNERVVVSDASQWVRLGAARGAQVKTNLEVFLAGSRGNPLVTQIKAIDSTARLFQVVRAEGGIAASKCGDTGSIIAGNLSALATGNGSATASLGNLVLSIKIVKCN